MIILSIVKMTEVERLLERNFHQINLNVIFVLYHFLKCYYKAQPIKLQNMNKYIIILRFFSLYFKLSLQYEQFKGTVSIPFSKRYLEHLNKNVLHISIHH